jgi:hypothetical protein
MIVQLGPPRCTPESGRLTAHVSWEEADRAPVQLGIETSCVEALVPRVEAFLPACAVIAQLTGERRLTTDAPVSPLLIENLPTALGWTRYLSRSDRPTLRLDLPVDGVPAPSRPARHAQFFSGGVDSMATLRLNHSLAPPGHPHRITDLVYVSGFEEESSDRSLEGVRAVAAEADLGLVQVRTDLARLDTPDRRYWQEFFYGAFLASVAQALAGRFTRVTVAPSSGSIGPTKRVGSLPQLDTNFSSDLVTMGHPHFETSRDERIAVIGDWGPGRRWLRPCSKNTTRGLNCGVCEKCLPTRVAIIAAGYDLRDYPAFDRRDLDAGELDAFRVFDPEIVTVMAEDHAPRLAAHGRQDLADAIRRMRDRFMSWDEWREQAVAEVIAEVPEGSGVQVVDLGQFDLADSLGERSVVHHWSAPACDGDPAREFRFTVEREKADGADRLAVFSSAFWWFDAFPWFGPLLDELGSTVAATERVRVVELR